MLSSCFYLFPVSNEQNQEIHISTLRKREKYGIQIAVQVSFEKPAVEYLNVGSNAPLHSLTNVEKF